MKTRKKLFLTLTTTLLTMPEIIGATEYVKCGGDNRFPLLFTNMTATFVNIIKILVPIFLVISGMVAEKKVRSFDLRKIVADEVELLFEVVLLLELVLTLEVVPLLEDVATFVVEDFRAVLFVF